MVTVTPHDMSAPQKISAPVEGVQLDPDKQLASSEAAPKEDTQAKPKEDDLLSPKLAALARKEKHIRDQARAFQAEKAALEAEKIELAKAKAWKERFEKKDFSVFQEAGYTGDELTQFLLNQPNPQDQHLQSLKKEIEQIKAAQADEKKQAEENTTKQYQQTLKQIKSEVTVLVDGNEEFETIKSMKSEDAVVALIEESFKETGTLMSIEDAAREVEEYLVEQALSLARLKKIQSKLAPSPETAPVEAAKKTHEPQKTSTATLSNRIATTTGKPLTARERRERAIAAFNGQLK